MKSRDYKRFPTAEERWPRRGEKLPEKNIKEENTMIKFIHDSWEGVMNMDKNPLRHINDLQVRHLTIQLLAWMWCITFSLYFGSFVVFGYTAAAHFIFILAIVITVGVFKASEKRKYYHHDGTFKYEETAGKYEDIW